MTPKDLNMVPFIDHMIESGVYSFKIEGRMRSIYYVSTVILIYRRLLDKIKNGTLTDEYKKYATNILNRVANRESTPQFFDKLPGVEEQYYLGRKEESNQDFLGLVLDYNNGLATIEQRNFFKLGDEVQFFGPDMKTTNWTVDNISDEDGNNIDVARHPQMVVKIKLPFKVSKDTMMRTKVYDCPEDNI
jgi:putative protease